MLWLCRKGSGEGCVCCGYVGGAELWLCRKGRAVAM